MRACTQEPPDPFATLNPRQREAVCHGLDLAAPDHRPLLLVAGAGSGKTNTLAYRVANLILKGADPNRILLLTFSRRAATEMERRAGQVIGRVLNLRASQQQPTLPWSGTFHGIGARLLREHALRIGLDPAFTIHDRGDSEDLIGLTRHQLGLSAKARRFPMKGTCLAIYSRVVNSTEALATVLRKHFPWCDRWEAELKGLFGAYVEAKATQNVLDFDDLLLFWAAMLTDAELANAIGGAFGHVLVDEYQDTNLLQATILKAMKPDGKGVTVVGDDAQSIYSFRGATVRNILDFPHQFSQPARIVTLDRNYRSTQAILDVSNAVIEASGERHAKTLWTDRPASRRPQLVLVPDEAQQARWVADSVLAQREAGLRLKSQAVLFRTSSHSAALELELARRNIPFVKFGGLKFLEAAHIKDMLAILRFAENPRGRIAGFRVAQLIPGVGPATATRLLDTMDQAAEPWGALAEFVPPAAVDRTEWQAFIDLYGALRAGQLAWPADLDVAGRWYLPHLERLHDDAQIRRGDLEQLSAMACGYGSRERFISELTLDPPELVCDRADSASLDEDYLILSTIHSAKGQEWTAVHVLNVVDGCIPSDMAAGSAAEIEEERRLLYVAMTRAKEHLHLLVPHRFYVTQQAARGDRHVYASRTRFITDIDAARFETVVWPQVAVFSTPQVSRGLPLAINIRERARAAWR